MRRELGRLSHTLVWRGALMLLLGLGAITRPEELLILALLAVGGIATLFGLYEMSIAISIRSRAKHWRLVLYAAMTVRAARLVSAGPLRWALTLWAGLDVGLAILVVTYREATIFALLFLGAVYAAAYGAWQLGVGVWLGRELRGHVHAATRPVGG